MPIDLTRVPNSFDPVARIHQYALTVKQHEATHAAAKARGLDADAICEEEFYCGTGELTRKAANMLLRYLNGLTPAEIKKLGGREAKDPTEKPVRRARIVKKAASSCCGHPPEAAIAGTRGCSMCLCADHG